MEKIKKCLRQKEFKQYSTRVSYEELELFDFQNEKKSTVGFSLTFHSNISTMYEEVLIVDEIGLLGSVGGSLGRFF